MADENGMRRPRTRSMLSFSSSTKRKSGLFGKGIDMTETKEEKEATHLHGKADPTRAVSEPQPAAWSFEASTIVPLRSIQHRDANGNIIADPDLANPTRSRFERPLDTIRSFEAAVDSSYARRPISRANSAMGTPHRQTQSQQGFHHPSKQNVENGGYYGNRFNNPRPDSYAESYGGQPSQQPPPRRFNQRVNSEPSLYGHNGQGVYPTHGYQQSYDTVATSANGSGGYNDQWRDSTDPSSESSSIDRLPQNTSKPEPPESYGFHGFGGGPQFQGPILEEHGIGTPAYGEPGYGGSPQRSRGAAGAPFQGYRAQGPMPPPHAPPKDDDRPRVPIKLGGGPPSPSTNKGEKRKSWLQRRFSRNG